MTRLCILLVLLSSAGPLPADDAYQSPEDFLNEVFNGKVPDARVLWLNDSIRETSSAIMGHPYPGLRIRYRVDGERSAWILEETGKEKPITVGLAINSQGIEHIRVLAFRESRGWEVRYPFFTDQFHGARLHGDYSLDRDIDGISGATLSVRALKKLARLALYLHSVVMAEHDTPAQK